MEDKLILFIASDDAELIAELTPLINASKYKIESYTSENECINHLDENPDILLIDYKMNYDLAEKEKKSVEVIEKIKEKKLDTKIFMFSDRESAKIYLSMLEE